MMRRRLKRIKQRVMAVLAAVAHPAAAPADGVRAPSGKKRIRSVFCAATAAVLVSAPSLAYAGTPTITWTEVDQSIDASDSYTWTDSKGNARYDTDISMRLVPNAAGDLGLIMEGVLRTTTSRDSYETHMVAAGYDGYFYTTDGYVTLKDGDGGAVTGVLYADPDNAPFPDGWNDIDPGKNRWWFSFEDGRVVMTDNNTVLQNSNGWWYLRDGVVDFGYTGFSSNRNGEWYITNGEADFDTYGIYQDSDNALNNGSDAYYYVVDGKVQEGMESDVVKVTGSDDDVSNGWYHISNGQVCRYECIAQNSNGWWYCDSNGKVDFSYTGTVTVDSDNKVASSGTTYTVTEGKVSK